MIGKAQPGAIWEGVAPEAELHTLAADSNDDVTLALGLNRMATLNGNPTRAINMSFGHDIEDFIEDTDGSSHLTQFIDWSAREHDVTYVAAWLNNDRFNASSPNDNYNGITVAASSDDPNDNSDSIYRFFSTSVNAIPNNTTDAAGPRTSIDLLAPGEFIRLLETGNQGARNEQSVDGTSYAAPHVTGTIALMHQHITNESLPSAARRHEVIKAALLNSADKLAGVHGSSRTVLDSNGNDWTQSEAFTGSFTSLDNEMGAGHLNAKAAIDQLSGGQHSGNDVPLIGWDLDSVGPGNRREYIFDQPLAGDEYIAITLTWDREVEVTSFNGNYSQGDQFTVDELNDLNVYLTFADSDDLVLDSRGRSHTLEHNVEHIFTSDYEAGEYKIVVEHAGGTEGGFRSFIDFGLAWRLGDDPAPLPGDNDGDDDVDLDDLGIWRNSFGEDTFGDTDSDRDTDGADFLAWQRNFDGPITLSANGPTAVYDPATGGVTLEDVDGLIGLRLESDNGALIAGMMTDLGGATAGALGSANDQAPDFLEWGNLAGITFTEEFAGFVLPAGLSLSELLESLTFTARNATDPTTDIVGRIEIADPQALAAVPEPSSLLLLAVGLPFMLLRKQKMVDNG